MQIDRDDGDIVVFFDMNLLEGKTAKEKYEALYIKIDELSNVLVSKGADEANISLSFGRKVGEIFITNSTRFTADDKDWIHSHSTGRFYLGGLNARWHLYLDDYIVEDCIKIESDAGNAILWTAGGKNDGIS